MTPFQLKQRVARLERMVSQTTAVAERRTEVIRLREAERLSFREVGERIGVGPQRARQIYTDALAVEQAKTHVCPMCNGHGFVNVEAFGK